ncbi:MAG: hypothetical protein M3Z66_21335 [Chloroflexota bacterium]|nr:hypothetical protein [Chloroflexota bacterium]
MGREGSASLVLGADLTPGLYRLRIWLACTSPQGIITSAELLLKTPSQVNLRSLTSSDLLHKEG